MIVTRTKKIKNIYQYGGANAGKIRFPYVLNLEWSIWCLCTDRDTSGNWLFLNEVSVTKPR